MAERRKEREAQSAALAALENEMRKSYAAEREANRKAYLERKSATESAVRDHGSRACAATACAALTAMNPCLDSAAPAREASSQSACGEPHNPDTEDPCGPHGNAPSGLHEKSGLPPSPPTKPPTVTTGGTPSEDEDSGSSSSPIPHPPSLSVDAETARRERDFIRRRQERVRKETAKKRKATIARKRREAAKACPPGSPSWLVREAASRLAKERGLSEDAVTERLVALGGVEFLVRGSESMGRTRCSRPSTVAAAVRALELHLDPDHAEMFGGEGNRERGTGREG